MPITRNPCCRFSSRHCPTRGRLSLQIPQLADQKCTSVGWPATSDSACACVPPNHSVAPSRRGISVPIFIAIVLFSQSATDYTETFLCNLWVKTYLRVQSLLARLPLSLAKTTGLQRLDHAQRLFRRTAHVQIVDHLVTKNAFRIDYEETTQRNAAVLDQHTVIARHLLGRIRRERVFQTFNATFVSRRVQPRALRVNGVGRDADDVGANVQKVLVTIAERRQLCRANEREVERIENEYEPLTFVIGEADRLVEFLDISRRAHFKIRRGLAYHRPLYCYCC